MKIEKLTVYGPDVMCPTEHWESIDPDGIYVERDAAKVREDALLEALKACVKDMEDDGYHDDPVCNGCDVIRQIEATQ
jgi:hypothetical protein